MKLRLRFVCFLLLLGVPSLFAQTPSKPTLKPAEKYSGNILSELAPNDNIPLKLHLQPKERVRAIYLLREVKHEYVQASDRRRLALYLLATLGYDYSANRDELLRAWRESDDDGVMELLNDLYKQGHKECLLPLMRDDTGYNVSTSEGIGEVYSDALTRHQDEFLAALVTLPEKRQSEVCWLMGNGGGGGIGSEEAARLGRILGRAGDPLALRCARQIRDANREAEEEEAHYAHTPHR